VASCDSRVGSRQYGAKASGRHKHLKRDHRNYRLYVVLLFIYFAKKIGKQIGECLMVYQI
jgi:hypothetical protein